MNYMKRPFREWIKGPLISTPQGWVVLLSFMVYGVLAVGFWGFGLAVPISASRESTGVFCACWPFIVFLFFVRDGAPGFNPSWASACLLAIAATTPLAFSVYRWLV